MLKVALDTHLKNFHLKLDFYIDEGKTLVLLGESGAGKSTVLRALAGLLHPESGYITLNGVQYYNSEQRIMVPPQERPFGYVFQDYVLFPHLTVFENVAFGLRAQGLPHSLVHQRVVAALKQVHLSEFNQRRPAQLSGGQQQRVAIARALVLQPQLLLLDEPLSALDVQTRREVRQELRRILANSSITTVMVTHHYVEALLFGQQILVMEQGRAIQQGGQRELHETPRSSYVAELVGVNFFHGQISGYEASKMCSVRLPTGIAIVAVLQESSSTSLPSIGEDAYVVVDPRSITLYHTPPEDSSARNIFYGEILHLLRLSAASGLEDGRVRVSLLLNPMLPPFTAEITESSATRMDLHEGQKMYATFKATEASVYT